MVNERYDKRTDRPEDHDYFNKYVDILLPLIKGEVLDIGCGQGWFTKLMSEKAEKITAIDKFSEQPDENKADNIYYVKGNLPEALPTLKYDVINSTEFVEHITEADFDVLLSKIVNQLKPGGHFIGSTPDVSHPSGNQYHLREYSLAELKEKFEKFGFVGNYYSPLPYLAVWDVWLA